MFPFETFIMTPVDDYCLVVTFFVFATSVVVWYLHRVWRRLRFHEHNITSPPPHTKHDAQSTPTISDKIDFLDRVGIHYGYATSKKGFIDDWRSNEFPTLIPPLQHCQKFDRQYQSLEQITPQYNAHDESIEPEVYLDYAGSAIPTRSLLSEVSHQCRQVVANPHSQGGGLASDRTLKLVQISRDCVMEHFGIDSEQFGLDELDEGDGDDKHATIHPGYQLVFTSGATESLRLVAERFPWSTVKFNANPSSLIVSQNKTECNDVMQKLSENEHIKSIQARSSLVYPRSVHTSVIGMRDLAMQRGAQFHCIPVDELRNATIELFQGLVENSMSFEYLQKKEMHIANDIDEEKKDEHCSNKSTMQFEDASEEKKPCKTIWLHHLLVLPVECNFGGDRFDWSNTTAAAKDSCFSSTWSCINENLGQSTTITVRHKWHILLDTAKAAATSPVNLPTLAPEGGPDYAIVSFYKLFGAPTGLGALFVKKNRKNKQYDIDDMEQSEVLQLSEAPTSIASGISAYRMIDGSSFELSHSPRQFFGGGSVDVVLLEEDFMVPRDTVGTPLASHRVKSNTQNNSHVDLGVMVHGTEHFRGIANLAHGFQEIDELGGMDVISRHATCLAAELVRRIGNLEHDNGSPVIQLYGQWRSLAKSAAGMKSSDALHHCPGPTVAFNVCDRDGSPIGYDEVSRLASLNCPPIQLRTGCFCNPGACQDAITLTNDQVLENYSSGHVCGDGRGIVNGNHTGAIRASFGKDSIWEDMDTLVRFIEKVFVSRGKALVTTNQFTDEDCSTTMIIDSLFVFPIKSCAATRVKQWPIDSRTGRLAYDREFALVNTQGAAMRLHTYPQMSKITTDIDLETQTMAVQAPNHEDLVLSLKEEEIKSALTSEDVQVCGILCKGSVWGGSKASRWFTSVLGVRCWLARHHEADKADQSSDNRQFAYSNEASLLVVSQRSISYLNSLISEQGWGRLVESRHFRPNIVVSLSYEEGEDNDGRMENITNPEDAWQEIIIKGTASEIQLKAVGKCARCQMVDVDPSSGMKGNTLRALAQYRRDRGRINFGTFFTGIGNAPGGNVWLEEGSDIHAKTFINS